MLRFTNSLENYNQKNSRKQNHYCVFSVRSLPIHINTQCLLNRCSFKSSISEENIRYFVEDFFFFLGLFNKSYYLSGIKKDASLAFLPNYLYL